MAHPRRPPAMGPYDYDVVIPVLDDPEGLALTIEALAGCNHQPRSITVVDDGSRPGIAVPTVGPPVGVVRHRFNRGPGAARNTGARQGDAAFVLFVDAGVTARPEAIETLLSWTGHPRVVAASPRIVADDASTRVGRYESAGSPLDVARHETEPSLVGVDRSVRYVPSTVLLVSRPALDATGGFDERLRFGEDVDLVWRLAGQGWVIVEPAAAATHPPRPTVAAFARQRFDYGASAGPLARRHGAALAPLGMTVPFATATVAGCLLPIRLTAGWWIATAAFDAARTGRLLVAATEGQPGSSALGAIETLTGWVRSTEAAIGYAGRVGWPVSMLMIGQPVSGRVRRRVLLAAAARVVVAVRRHGWGRAPLALLDDVAYGTGVWAGALAARTSIPVVPRLVRKR